MRKIILIISIILLMTSTGCNDKNDSDRYSTKAPFNIFGVDVGSQVKLDNCATNTAIKPNSEYLTRINRFCVFRYMGEPEMVYIALPEKDTPAYFKWGFLVGRVDLISEKLISAGAPTLEGEAANGLTMADLVAKFGEPSYKDKQTTWWFRENFTVVLESSTNDKHGMFAITMKENSQM